MWYRYTASGDGVLVANTFDSNFDTVLAVYTEGPILLTQVACNDDAGGTRQSRISFPASAQTTYYFQVSGWFGDAGELVFNVDMLIPPSNDDRADAILIEEFPYTNSQSTEDATMEEGEPSPCGMGASVWYRFTPPQDAFIIADTFGSDFDTSLAVYDATEPNDPITCDDFTPAPEGGPPQARISFQAYAGITYQFQVGGWQGDQGDLVFNAVMLPPSTNDDRADAILIEEFPYTNSQSTEDATMEEGEPSPCGMGASVWYRFTPPQDAFIIADTFGSDFDTSLAVYDATEPNDPITCDDFTPAPEGGPPQARISFQASAGITYQFQVGGWRGDQGNLVFTVRSFGQALRSESKRYEGAVSVLRAGPCEAERSVGGPCFTLQGDESAAFVQLVDDAMAAPVGAVYRIDSPSGPSSGRICGGDLLPLPPGATTIRFWVDGPSGPSNCSGYLGVGVRGTINVTYFGS